MTEQHPPMKKVMLLGPASTGKTLLFQRLAQPGSVHASFYPGTESIISRGVITVNKEPWELIDPPPVRNIYGNSLADQINLELLLEERPALILQVMTPETTEQTMLISIQCAEMGIPFLMIINKKDSVAYTDYKVDLGRLYSLFHAHIVVVSALLNEGVTSILHMIGQSTAPRWVGQFEPKTARGIESLAMTIEHTGVARKAGLPPRFIAIMLITQNKPFITWLMKRLRLSGWKMLERQLDMVKFPLWTDQITKTWAEASVDLAGQITTPKIPQTTPRSQAFMAIADHPFWGWLVFLGVAVVSFFLLVKVAAGMVVTFLETEIFGKYVIPGFISFISQFPLSPFVKDMFVGDYGLLTMGLAYLLGIIFPVVFMLFIIEAIMETSGYLVHLKLLVSRLFARMGIPVEAFPTLFSGFGCSVLALAKTKLLPSAGQRTLVAFLLVLAVPCIAQMGVIINMLTVIPTAYALLFVAIVAAQWYVTGFVLSRILPGVASGFVHSVEPLRIPRVSDVWTLVWQRTEWYFREAFPLFMLATLVLFVAAQSGFLDLLQRLMAPLFSIVLGLPPQSAEVFVLGFLRRDYGAARLYEMTNNGSLNAIQVLVALLMVTLSMPCIAAFVALIKEQGFKQALRIAVFIFFYVLVLGGVVNLLLHL